MWEFRKLFSTTSTQPTPLESAFIEQSKALVGIVQQQQDTLDRIVTARYDRPVAREPQQHVADAMSSWGLNDQGEVRPDEVTEALGKISTATDAEWVEGK